MIRSSLRALLLAAAIVAGLPTASAQSVAPGAEALDASLVGARFRSIGSTSNGAQRIFTGLPDLRVPTVGGTPNRVEAGGNWGTLATTSTIRFSLDRAQDRLVAQIGNATGAGGAAASYTATYTDLGSRLAAIKGTQFGLDDLNVLRVSLRREANASLTLTDLRINGQLLPGVTLSAPAGASAGRAEWSVVDVCLGAGNGFSFSAELTRAGTPGNSQEGNKIDLVAGVSRARGLRCVDPVDLVLDGPGFDPATITAGQTSTLVLTARNQGPGALGAADGARIDLSLPAPLVRLSDDASCDVSALPAVRCALGALAAGAAREVRILVGTPATVGTRSVTVAAAASSAIADAAPGNNARSDTLVLNAAPPPTVVAITRLDPSPGNLASKRWRVHFDRAVSGVDAGDFTLAQANGLAGAAITAVDGSGSERVVHASTGNGLGSLRLDLVDDGSIVDAGGLQLGGPAAGDGSAQGETYVVDRIGPQAAVPARLDADPAEGQVLRWSVRFDEAVAGLDAGDFSLVAGGAVAGASIVSVAGGGTDYVVEVDRGKGGGTLRLDVVDDDTVRDALGNPLGGAGAGNGNRSGEAYAIDAVAPGVAGLVAIGAPANGEFVGGVTLDGAITRLLVRWSEPMREGPAGDAARFVLLGSGSDGQFTTSACGPVLGDDQPLALAASYLASETRSVLVPAVADGLRPGRWRLLFCAGLEDRYGNALAAVAPVDFEVAFDNALVNPNFDGSLEGFAALAPAGDAGFALLADDAQGTLASRALEITAAAGAGTYTLSQCVPAPLLGGYGTGLRARADGDASLALEVELRRLPGCEGPVLGNQVLSINTVAGQWTRTDGVSAPGLSTGVFSARVTLRATLGDGNARVAIDNLYFDRRGTLAEPDGLFGSSFED
ncbi:MAG: hypothetical protein ACK59M_06420 [Pseudomonadota bacterium]